MNKLFHQINHYARLIHRDLSIVIILLTLIMVVTGVFLKYSSWAKIINVSVEFAKLRMDKLDFMQ